MRIHSDTAWNIASRYSDVLASETRDLAAQIDEALNAERETCAKLATERERYSMPIPCPDNKPGCLVAHSVPGTRDRTPGEIAAAIRARNNS